jgi:heme/copper-type cytochrome/quinol oxidase subunit 2
VCSGSHQTSRYLAVAEVAVECFQIHPHQKAHRPAEMFAQAYRHQTNHRFVVGAAAGYFVRISLFLVIVYFHQIVLPLVAVAAYFAQARRTDHQVAVEAVEAVEAVAECFVQIILYFVTVYCRRIVRRSAEVESLCQTDQSSVAMEGCQRDWTF